MKKRSWIIFLLIAVVLLSLVFMRLTGNVVTSINTCIDTDDGKDYSSKGRVYGDYYLFLKESYESEDYCEDNVLTEYYCTQEGMHSYKASIEYKCKLGCEDGECIEIGAKEGEEKPMPAYKSSFQVLMDKIKEAFGV